VPEFSRNLLLELYGNRHHELSPNLPVPFFPPPPSIPPTGKAVWSVLIPLGGLDLHVCINKFCLGLGGNLGFRPCESLQGNAVYRKGRYEFYLVYMCVVGALQLASICCFRVIGMCGFSVCFTLFH
jgi:hypothetical protein